MAQRDMRQIGSIPFKDLKGLLKDFSDKCMSFTVWECKQFLKRMSPFPKDRDITVPEGMNLECASAILEAIQTGGMKAAVALFEREELLAEWRKFYEAIFTEIPAEKLNFSDLVIPENPEDFNWLVIVLRGLTCNGLFAKCKEKFGAWRFCNDLDKEVVSIRTTETTYAVRFRDRVEADEENKGLSLKVCQKSDDICIREGITLEERLIFELFYWWKTGGQHLDLKNWTLCSGSVSRDGYAVLVSWSSDDRLFVYYTSSDYGSDNLRPRSAVFLKLPEAA